MESPKFWRWARLRVTNENLSDIRGSRLVRMVPEIKITDNINHNNRIRLVGELFQDIVEGQISHLQRLHFRPTDLSSLHLNWLSAVTRIVHCSLTDCRLSPDQINVINTNIVQADKVRQSVSRQRPYFIQ